MVARRWIVIIALAGGLGGTAAALAPPAANRASGASRRCPYDFRSDMPADEFCVYRGVLRSEGGAVCHDDAVVIWSAHASLTGHRDGIDATNPAHDVFFGFVEPALVLRAVAPARMSARFTDYSIPSDHSETAVDGLTTLERRIPGSGVLTMKLRRSVSLAVDAEARGCAFDSYRGVFIGVMRRPGSKETRPSD